MNKSVGHDMGGSYERPPLISVVMPVLAPTPFLRAMTEFAIKTLRLHADNPFELVIVEAGASHFMPDNYRDLDQDRSLVADVYRTFQPPIGGVKECNAGFNAASGEFLVMTGNDIIVPPHWDTYLLTPFDQRHDCGMSTMAIHEPGAIIGPKPGEPTPPEFTEGMFSAFTMFRNKDFKTNQPWRYDEHFERIYQDSDLYMRISEAGYRSYRYNRAHAYHFGAMTNRTANTATHNPKLHAEAVARDEAKFYHRWGDNPTWSFAMVRHPQLSYGHEHINWLVRK